MSPDTTAPDRRFAGRFVRVGFGLAVGLLLAEGAARVVEARRSIGDFARFLDAATVGCASSSLTRIYEVVGRCGRDGNGFLLDQARALGNPSARRVMVIGDSVGEQSWTLHLGDALQREGHGPVEVWNASVGGYGTCQEAAAARELLPLARPDVVVVETCPNDVFGSPVVLTGEGGSPEVVLGGGRLTFPRPLLHIAMFRLGLTQLAVRGRDDTTVEAARACARELVATVGSTPLVVVHFPGLVDDPAHPLLADEADVLAAWSDTPGIRLRERLTRLGPLAELRESSTDLIHPRESVQADIAGALVEDVVAAMAGAPAR